MSPRIHSRNGFFARCRRALASKRSSRPLLRDESARAIEVLEARIAPAVTIVGTLQDSFTDADGDGKAEVGDIIHYTETIQNIGDTDATLVQVQNAIDAATTLVPGSLKVSPLAIAHSYNAAGNTALTVATGAGVKLGAMDLDGVTSFAGLNVTPGTFPTSQGGLVTIAADGSFTYVPQTGDENITDTFTYSVVDGDGLAGTGTVSISLGEVVWYVDSSYDGSKGASDGSSVKPYTTLTQISGAAGSDQAGDIIHVVERAGDYDGNLTLLNGQRLYGSGVALTVNSVNIVTAGANTTFKTTAANTNAITLGQNNQLFGITVNDTTGADIFGANVGNVSFQKVTLAGTGKALDLSNGTFNGSIDSITVASSSSEGIKLTSIAGNFTVGGKTTIATGAGTGVLLSSVSGSVTFRHGLAITTSSGTGFSATGGGTVAILDASKDSIDNDGDGATDEADEANTITATSGSAFILKDTTIGSGGITFRSITSNAGNNVGISLENTGTSGGFTITGTDGADADSLADAGTGGGISGKTGANGATAGVGIYLSNTSNVSISGMLLSNFDNFAIRGNQVTNFTLNTTTISGFSGNDAAFDEGAIVFDNLLGSASITSSSISGGLEDNIDVENTSGTLNRLTISNSTIGSNSTAFGEDGLVFVSNGTATMNLSVQNSTFTGARSDLIQTVARDTSNMNVVFTGNKLSNNHLNILSGGGGAVFEADHAGGAANLTFTIDNNTFRDALGIGLNVYKGPGNGAVSGTISNNTIGVSGVANSGSVQASGIQVDGDGGGTVTVAITNNTIRQYNEMGILLNAGSAAIGTVALNATVTGNTIEQPGSVALNAIHVIAGTNSGNSNVVSLKIEGNTTENGGASGQDDIVIRQRFNSTVRLPGYTGAATDTTAVNLFVASKNTGNETVVSTASGTGGGFTNTPGGAAPTQPLLFVPAIESGAEQSVSTDAGWETPGGSVVQPPVVNEPTGDSQSDITPEVITGTDGDGVLSQSELDALVAAAIARWEAAGLTTEQVALLHSVSFTVSDLPGWYLGEATGSTIKLDVDGAGNGWFVDSTPLDDSEFSGSGTRLGATAIGGAAGRVDALTTVMHELGHVLGLEDTYANSGRDDLMYGWISFGERRVAGTHQADGAVPHADEGSAFALSPLTIGTLSAGSTVRVVFDARVNNPFTNAQPQVSAQGTISGSNFTTVLTNDPDTAAANDATVTLVDLPDVSVVISSATVSEDGATNIVYTFTRTGDLSGALTVNFNVGGSASFNDDYTQSGASSFGTTTGTVTFEAGVSTTSVIINPTADTTVEANESVTLTLASGTGYDIVSPTGGTGTITNDDTDVNVTVSPVSVSEDGSTNLVYTFTRMGVTTGSLVVNFNVGGTAGFGSDYTASGTGVAYGATSGTITFADGQTTATVTIDPTADSSVETNEIAILTVISGAGYNAGTTSVATGTISNDDADITLAVSSPSVAEDGSGNLVYTFTREGFIDNALTVNFTYTGPALFGTDYTQSGAASFAGGVGSVIFAAGSATATVTIDPTADTSVEADEAVTVTLAPGAGYNVVTSSAVTGTIRNDDTDVTLALTSAFVTEDGSGNLIYTFTRSGVTSTPLTVNFSVGGTAAFGTDYTANVATFGTTTGSVTFAGGETTATVILDPSADITVESDETAILTLTPGTGYNVATPGAVSGTITNDDTDVSVSVAPGSVTEDGSGNLVYTFTRTGVTSGALQVAFSLAGTAAYNTDYEFKLAGGGLTDSSILPDGTGTITFAPGATTGTLTFTPKADNTVEADETATLSLISGTGYNVGTLGSATGTILNDDADITLTVSPSTVDEDGSGNLVYTFTRTGAISSSLTVGFTVGGTAIFGSDYAVTGASGFSTSTGTVTFAANSNTATVIIDPTPDTDGEPDENVALTLTGGAGYNVITSGSVTGTIRNDDTAVSVQLVSSSISEAGPGGLVYRFTRTGDTSTALPVNFNADGTAIFSTDYTQSGASSFDGSVGTVIIPVGSSTTEVTFTPVNDTRVEGDETARLTIVSGANYGIALANSALGTITDNDTATVSLVSSTSSVAESAGSHNVGVELVITANGVVGSGTLERAVSVNLSDLLTGSATGALTANDYSFATAQTVTFASGEAGATKNVTVTLADDTRVEGSETINLSLGGLVVGGTNTQVSLGATTAQTITITDNDTATVSLVNSTSSVAESAGSHNVGVELVITANGVVGSGTLERAVSVNLSDLLTGSATGALTGNDYSFATAQTVTFASGEAGATKNVTLTLADDTRVEGSETVNLSLGGLVVGGTNTQVSLGATTAQTITITDNDTATVSLVSGTSSVAESAGSHNVGVELVITANGVVGSGTLERAVSVNLSDVLTGSATGALAANDYTFASPTMVTFAGGEAGATKNVTLTLADDTRVEGSETINLSLGGLVVGGTNTQVSLGATTAQTITITDNDTATVSLVNSTSSVAESAGSHNVGVELVITANGVVGSGTLERAVSVNLSDLLTGSATGALTANDYSFATAQTVTFASGEAGATKNVTLTLADDTRVEGSETVNLSLGGLVVGGTNTQVSLGATTAQTITITDNDTATVSLVSGTSSVAESAGSHNVGVELVITANGVVGSGTLERAVSVNLSDLLTGSATGALTGNDYSFATAQTVTFASGEAGATKNVTVTLADDTRVEGSETVNLSLGGLVVGGTNTQVSLGATTAQTITITDNDTATVSLVSGTSSVAESAGSHNVGVELVITANGVVGSGTLERAVSVNLSDLLTGSATGALTANDYSFATAQTVTFASGEAGATKNVTLTLADDTRVEGSETVNLSLGGLVVGGTNTQVSLGATTAQTITITDNDTATVSLVNSTSSVTESAGSHNVGVQLVITANGVVGSGTLERAVSVNLSDLLTGSATGALTANDYTFASAQTVTFASGEAGATKNVTLTLADDTRVEGSETVNLSLGGLVVGGTNTQVSLGATTAQTITITDNDTATVSLVSSTSSVAESAGSHNVGVQLVITANGVAGSGTLERAVSVNLSDLLTGSATGALTANDYTFASAQTVTFASGEAGATKNVTLTLADDTRVEGSETINLSLGGLVVGGTNTQVSLGATTAQTITITDNDTATVSLVNSTSSVAESAGSHNVGVELVITANGVVGSGTLERAVSVNLSDLLTGSATGALTGNDYSFATAQTVTFASGEAGATKNVTLTLADDTRVEGSETVNLSLGGLVVGGTNTQVSLGATTAQTITITDNDTATVSLVSGTSSVAESAGSHNVGVQLLITANGVVGSGTLERDVLINFADLHNGTADGFLIANDYIFASPTMVTFASGEAGSTKNVSVTLTDDTRVEGDETINLVLTPIVDRSGGQVSLGAITAQTITITDNDTATVSLVSSTSSVAESAGSHNVGVELVITANGVVGSGTLERAVSVNLSDLLTGSATGALTANDYTFASAQTVTFASGEAGATKNVTLTLADDTRVEGSETVNLSLGGLVVGGTNTQVSLGATTAQTITITDNDTATVSLVNSTSSVAESAGSHNVGVELVITANGVVGSGTLERAVSVNLADLLDGTAKAAGNDYTLTTPRTVTFNAGEQGSTKSVEIALVDDIRVEGDETIRVALNSLLDGTSGQVTLGATAAQTITIADNDTAVINFVTVSSSVSEAAAPHNIGVKLVITANGELGTGTLERDVTVNVQDLLNGTAGSSDYTFASPQTVTFAAGEASSTKNVVLDLTNDLHSEGFESLTLQLNTLVDGTGSQVALIAPISHEVTIVDNDIDLRVSQTESSGTVIAGSGSGNLTYVITVTNTGMTNASGVILNENLTLPAGVTLQSMTPNSGSFTVTTNPDGDWVLDHLAAGEQATLTVVLTVNASSAKGTDVITSLASITSADQTLINATDDSVTESTSIDRRVDLEILANDGVTIANPEGTLAYVINVKNAGPSDATGVVITETLPRGTTFNAGASTAGWAETAPGSGVYTLNIGTVQGSSSAAAVTFAVTVINPVEAGQDDVLNIASVTDDGTAGADLVIGTNRAEDTDTLNAAPELSLAITDSIGKTVARGGLVYYTLTYSNVGSQNATGVYLIENIPANSSFVASESDANWVLQADGSYRLNIGSLAVGTAPQQVTFAVRVDSTLPAGFRELVNNASIDDDSTNAVSDLNESDSAKTLVYQGIYVVAPGITLPKKGPDSTLRVFDIATGEEALSFLAYEASYRDSVRIAVGDMNGDGFDDIITATRTGTGRVRVFDGVTGEQFEGAFAEINPFNGRGQKGAYVAVGDVTGDHHDDIIVGSALGGGKVQVYDGVTGSLVTNYTPFGKSYKGGVRVSVGDINGDGVEDIVAGQGNFGNSVKVLDGDSTSILQTIKVGGKSYRGGVDVAAGDINGDGKAEIITGRNSKSAPWVEIFNGADSTPLGKFLAFESSFRNGIRVGVGDVNIDGIADIVVGAGYKGDSRVRIFSGSGYDEIHSFTAFPNYRDVSLFVAGSSPVPVVLTPTQQPV